MKTNEHQTDGQRQNVKKYLVFAAMGLIFLGCMYLIFSPSSKEKENTVTTFGFNSDIPMPSGGGMIDDKREAYQQEQMQQRQDARMRSLQDFTALLGSGNTEKTDEIALFPDAAPVPAPAAPRTGGGSNVPQSRAQTPIQTSAQAYHDLNRTLGNFYEKPPEVLREDPEKEQLREELEVLKMQMGETTNRKNVMEEQLELMEKSFQMAAKYMPGSSSGAMGTVGTVATDGAMGTNDNATELVPETTRNVSGKTTVATVDRVREQTVSILAPEMSNAEFIATYSKPRNMGFLTATSDANAGIKNTVSACIHADQTIMDGQNVRLRLLEPMQAGNIVIPRNSRLTGTAKIQGERLGITLNSLEYEGIIIPVELRVYDLDGQSGIYIPNMAELSAAKEIIANMGTSAGTSITLADDAGKQFAADMGRNAIQGVSQFTAKKLREVKVHLRDGYRVYLIANK